MQNGLFLPQQDKDRSRRDLTWNFVNLSEAVRDFTIDLSISRFRPDDIRSMRNLVQGVISAVLAIRPDTTLFDIVGPFEKNTDETDDGPISSPDDASVLRLICQILAGPTKDLIEAMSGGIDICNVFIMAVGGYKQAKPTNNTPDIPKALDRLRVTRDIFDSADASLTNHSALPSMYSDHPEVVKLFLFVHPVRQATDKVEALLGKILHMQLEDRPLRLRLPSYPLPKALLRCNAQVRHDRGGLTAGFYFQSKDQLERTMRELQSKVFVPTPRNPAANDASGVPTNQMPVIGQYEQEKSLPWEKMKVCLEE